MTRTEAITILKNAAWLGTNEDREKIEQAVFEIEKWMTMSKTFENYMGEDINVPSNDLISRQAAQTELMMKCERYTLARESHGMGYVEWSDELIDLSDAMDAIRDMPSAQPEPPWIPCNERLPETNGNYLCTNKSGWYDINMNVWMGENWLYEDEEPLAWMPLPEPWRGGED